PPQPARSAPSSRSRRCIVRRSRKRASCSRMTTRPVAPDYVEAATPQGGSGTLRHAGEYLFTYSADASSRAEISLTMPLRAAQYVSADLHPIFQMNLPEGYVLDLLRQRFAKASSLNPMLLLALTGGDTAIGRVTVSAPGITPSAETRGE